MPTGRGRHTPKLFRLLQQGEATNEDQSDSGLMHAAAALFRFHGWAEDVALEEALASPALGPILEPRRDLEFDWARSWGKAGEGFASEELRKELDAALAASRGWLVAGLIRRVEHEVHGELIRLARAFGTTEPFASDDQLAGALELSVGSACNGLAGLLDRGVIERAGQGSPSSGGRRTPGGWSSRRPRSPAVRASLCCPLPPHSPSWAPAILMTFREAILMSQER